MNVMNEPPKPATRLWIIPTVLVVSFVAGFIWIALEVQRHGHGFAWDDAVFETVRAFESPGVNKLMRSFTRLGDTTPVVVISVLILIGLAVLRYRIELAFFVFVIGGSALLNLALKQWLQRARPIGYRLIEAPGFSFPSGHSMAAFTLYGVTTYLLWKHIPRWEGRLFMACLGTALTIMIGVSRIYLGVHYPSDVIGAYMASGAWLLITIGAFRYWQASRRSRR